ncbi:acyltransferase family protein [Agrococcus sp. Marseille-Q4369]|uniref:acyltransferase family protein n=1 Tax=Agrococcus sp. Marseille-Q4369 TaxID=2810513 RepID=UPI001B8AA646|nr:acyltransferase family protein [Agrococcus sp. Marseille-Q4369]QUW18546.1 acyltransferase [Agrococcus sp. Marseille-Q4369]
MHVPSPPRRLDVQGLRAIASLLVASYHVWFGNVSGGVDAFFAIGGFLLATSLAGEIERTGSIDVPRQLRRTLQRLLPMAGIVVLVVGVAMVLSVGPMRLVDAIRDILAAATFTENWRLAASATAYVDAGHDKSALQHFWAMGVQGQFTVLLIAIAGGLALLLGRRARDGGKAALAAFLGVTVVASWAYARWRLAADPVPVYYDTFARAWELALGGFAALVLTRIPLGPVVRALLAGIGLGLLLTAGLLPEEWTQPGPVSLWPVAGALLILLAGHGGDGGPVAALLRWRPLVWLGGISYGVYLWHWPLLKGLIALDPSQSEQVGVLQGAVVIVTAIALSWCSAHLIRKAAAASRRLARDAVQLLVPAIAAAAVVALLVVPVVQKRVIADQSTAVPAAASAWELERWIADAVSTPPALSIGEIGAAGQPSEWVIDGCTTVAVGREDDCHYDGGDSAEREVWLLGDSHAVGLAQPLRAALRGTADLQLLGRAGCPFTDAPDVREHKGRDAAACEEHIDRVMALAEERRPDLAVITYGAWWAGTGFEHLSDGVGVRLAEGTLALAERLHALGIETVWLDAPPPASLAAIERCLAAHAAEQPTDLCSVPLEPGQLERHRQMVEVLRSGSIDVVETIGWYCDVERMLCPLIVNGVPTWTDDLHLAAAAGMQRVAVLAGELWPRVR